MNDEIGTIYLIHFDRPFSHAKHYVGWTSDLDARMGAHASGRGSCLMRHIKEAGIGWTLAATWEGTRTDERTFKNRRNTPRVCPMCAGHVKKGEANPWLDVEPAGLVAV